MENISSTINSSYFPAINGKSRNMALDLLNAN